MIIILTINYYYGYNWHNFYIFLCASPILHLAPQPPLCFAWATDIHMWIWTGTDSKGSSHADLSRAECAGEQVARSKAGEQVFIPRKISRHRPGSWLRKHSFMKSFPPVMPKEAQPSIFLPHLQLSESFPGFLGSGQQQRGGESVEDHMWEVC